MDRDALRRSITLLSAEATKGLEFDHVVVVEPAAIVREGLLGLNALYVALTRATQRLSVLHAEDLPEALAQPDPADAPPAAHREAGKQLKPESLPEVPGMDLGGSFSEAFVYAKLKHGGQARRGTAVPYLSHLLSVCALVLDDGGTEAEAIAALLHDAAEDHGGSEAIGEIAAKFGDEVAGIVALCTDPIDAGPDWREVKRAHIDTLGSAPATVRRVALAEKLDNARAVVRNLREIGGEVWPRVGVEAENLVWYFTELSGLFSSAHSGALAEELASQVDEMRTLAGLEQ